MDTISTIATLPEAALTTETDIDSLRELLDTFVSGIYTDDIMLLQPSPNSIGIAAVRRVQEEIQFPPRGTKRVVVIWNAQELTLQAQNALLKILEEPPSHTQLILLTHADHQLLATITSRCRQIALQPDSPISSDATNDATDSTAQQIAADMIAFITSSGNSRKSSYTQAIRLAEKAKDRTTAQQAIKKAVQQLHKQPSKISTQAAQILLAALPPLEGNVSARLVIEDCFFEIHRIIEASAQR